MASAIVDAKIYRDAAALNRDDPFLSGSLLKFPNYGQLVVTGDLHGHQRNLQRIQTFCDLDHAPARHVILHELIHSEPEDLAATDASHVVLLQAANWKRQYPDQVHFIQGNHELAQLTNHEISKGGRIVTHDFYAGVKDTYGDEGDDVYQALLEFVSTFPLAARTANRVFVSHSLPGHRDVARFDVSMFDRPLTDLDLSEGGSVYPLLWGRYQNEQTLRDLAERLDVDLFICGHQPQETGYDVRHERMLILASDHNHGVILPFDLRKSHTMTQLVQLIRPLASIA
jgi:hypothetical protein